MTWVKIASPQRPCYLPAMAKTILVVDDDPDLVEILCSTLTEAGYEAVAANTGAEGLKKARALSPDLILLDLVLPEMDGYAVCEALRNDAHTTDIPIIMLTGVPGELPRLAGVESGATDFIRKPYSPQNVVDRVQAALGKPNSALRPPAPSSPQRQPPSEI